jgi:hypothetical protein
VPSGEANSNGFAYRSLLPVPVSDARLSVIVIRGHGQHRLRKRFWQINEACASHVPFGRFTSKPARQESPPNAVRPSAIFASNAARSRMQFHSAR